MVKTFTNWTYIVLLASPMLLGAALSKGKPVAEPTGEEDTAAARTQSQLTPEELQSEPATTSEVTGVAGPLANFAIDWYSINCGGTVNAASTNFKMGGSIGQSVAGAAASTNYQMGIGFWYGADGGGSCACDCHADPAPIGSCDGNQDVLDVVQTVNVAFRGAAAILDPNANCLIQTTDVNCSGATDVLDVVRMVNVAFRGANAATEFCVPCP